MAIQKLTTHSKTKVLIVGAGPTGLVLALWLRQKNIPFRIIDKSQKAGETSRALAVQARTLEFYRQLGIANELLAAGVIADRLDLYRNGKLVATAMLGPMGQDLTPFPHLLFCAQDVHESILVQKLASLGVSVERQTQATEVVQTDSSVTALVQSPQGEEQIQAEYLVGCDGAHSIVRNKVALEFPGGTYKQVFFVADVKAHGAMVHNDRLQISLNSKGFCIVMPIPTQGSVRLTGLVPAEAECKSEITFADVAESIKRNTGLTISNVNWFSHYHVHHRVAEKFQRGRVFLAGDAGHIHSPAGGQGMNTGIGDAINLAWKLTEVLEGRASTKLLASYEVERIAFARVLVRTTDRVFQLIASRSQIGSVLRSYILPTLFSIFSRSRRVTKFLFNTVSQLRIQYRSSPLSQFRQVKLPRGAARPGDRLPWVQIGQSDNHSSLESMGWQIHVYGSMDVKARSASQVPIHQFPWNAETYQKGLLKNKFYLIRPDGYISMILDSTDVDQITSFFRTLKAEA